MTKLSEPSVAMRVGFPDRLMAGAPARIGLQLLDRASNEVVSDVVDSHERPLHLIVVSDDLEHFQHVHPWPAADGSYLVDVTFVAGHSHIFLEFLRASGETVLLRDSIGVEGEPARLAILQPSTASALVDAFRVHLEMPASIRAGRPTPFIAEVSDRDSGAPVTALTPYLGAAAHVVIIDAEARTFGHEHASAGAPPAAHLGAHAPAAGATMHGGHGGHETPTRFGPRFHFEHTFPHGGMHRAWVQFGTPARAVATAQFDVEVGA